MTRFPVPKEFMLEKPACYDDWKFKQHMKGLLSITSIKELYDSKYKNLFGSFFRSNEHADVAYDIFKYIVDKDELIDETVIIHRFTSALYEAGFFG